jgi:MoaA/NifB/PqqE/SkfB family radical SAM enzyme
MEHVQLNSAELSAPLRLDCALTYRLSAGNDPIIAPSKRVERELTTDEWQTVIDKAWAAGIPHIVFTGGEATLRDDLPMLIAHAEKNGQVAGLITDGIKLADSAYLENLLKTGLDHLMIILPTVGEPNWQSLKNSINADIFLSVHLTVTPQNVSGATALMDDLREAGVENISLSISNPSLKEQASGLHRHASIINMRMVTDLPVPYSDANPVAIESAEDAEPVGAGKTWLYVEPDGDVLPAQGFSEQVLGNIFLDSWEKIYPGSK